MGVGECGSWKAEQDRASVSRFEEWSIGTYMFPASPQRYQSPRARFPGGRETESHSVPLKDITVSLDYDNS
jgi:hypothetical protein